MNRIDVPMNESMFHLRRINFASSVLAKQTPNATEKNNGVGPKRVTVNGEELLLNDQIESSKDPKCQSTLIL